MKLNEWIEIGDSFLMNKPAHGPMPRGQQWEYYLWAKKCTKFQARIKGKMRTWTTRKKYLHTITAPTRRAADIELEKLIHRHDVILLEK